MRGDQTVNQAIFTTSASEALLLEVLLTFGVPLCRLLSGFKGDGW